MRHQISKNRLIVGTLVSAVALPVGAIGGAGSANATCFSAFGIDLFGGGGCSSSLTTIAIGIGASTTANAEEGFLGVALALGPQTTARIGEGAFFSSAIAAGLANDTGETTEANNNGNFSLAYAGGPNTLANLIGNFSVALVQGSEANASAGDPVFDKNGFANFSFNFGNGPATERNTVSSGGSINLAANLGGSGIPDRPGNVQAFGILTNAINLGGSGNNVRAGDLSPTSRATFSSGWSVFGSNNTVNVGPGPVAVGAAFGSVDGPVEQPGPGININNFGDNFGNDDVSSLAATRGTQGTEGLKFFTPTGDNNKAGSNSGNTGFPRGSALKAVGERITNTLKAISDKVAERRAARTEKPETEE